MGGPQNPVSICGFYSGYRWKPFQYEVGKIDRVIDTAPQCGNRSIRGRDFLRTEFAVLSKCSVVRQHVGRGIPGNNDAGDDRAKCTVQSYFCFRYVFRFVQNHIVRQKVNGFWFKDMSTSAAQQDEEKC